MTNSCSSETINRVCTYLKHKAFKNIIMQGVQIYVRIFLQNEEERYESTFNASWRPSRTALSSGSFASWWIISGEFLIDKKLVLQIFLQIALRKIPLNLLLPFSEQPTILQGSQEVYPDILFIILVRKHFFQNTFYQDRMQLPSVALVSRIFHQMGFY